MNDEMKNKIADLVIQKPQPQKVCGYFKADIFIVLKRKKELISVEIDSGESFDGVVVSTENDFMTMYDNLENPRDSRTIAYNHISCFSYINPLQEDGLPKKPIGFSNQL